MCLTFLLAGVKLVYIFEVLSVILEKLVGGNIDNVCYRYIGVSTNAVTGRCYGSRSSDWMKMEGSAHNAMQSGVFLVC